MVLRVDRFNLLVKIFFIASYWYEQYGDDEDVSTSPLRIFLLTHPDFVAIAERVSADRLYQGLLLSIALRVAGSPLGGRKNLGKLQDMGKILPHLIKSNRDASLKNSFFL
jgi:hypothetical protein